MLSRRSFLSRSAAALACAGGARAALGGIRSIGPLGLPIGLQLYTVREAVAADLPGTLRKVAAIGYGEVELAGMLPIPARQLRTMLEDLGLRAPSMHSSMADLQKGLTERLEYARELGAEYLVCSYPSAADGRPLHGADALSITLDDWYWNAEQLNRIGAATQNIGIHCGYHNHNIEFRPFGDTNGYETLLTRTTPALVTMELDIAWVVTAGLDPTQFLRAHGARISLLHVKDVRRDAHFVQDRPEAQTTDLGAGRINWREVFASVAPGSVTHYFVEQENFTTTPMQAAQADFDYLRKLGAARP